MSGFETAPLRMWRDEDLDVHARVCAGPEAMRYISGGATRTREQRGATVARFVRAWEKRGYGMWAAAEKEKGELVGRIGLL